MDERSYCLLANLNRDVTCHVIRFDPMKAPSNLTRFTDKSEQVKCGVVNKIRTQSSQSISNPKLLQYNNASYFNQIIKKNFHKKSSLEMCCFMLHKTRFYRKYGKASSLRYHFPRKHFELMTWPEVVSFKCAVVKVYRCFIFFRF